VARAETSDAKFWKIKSPGRGLSDRGSERKGRRTKGSPVRPTADQVSHFGRSCEAFWPHRGVEAVNYWLYNNARRNFVAPIIVAHDGNATGAL
jgi:hypothetical protein